MPGRPGICPGRTGWEGRGRGPPSMDGVVPPAGRPPGYGGRPPAGRAVCAGGAGRGELRRVLLRHRAARRKQGDVNGRRIELGQVLHHQLVVAKRHKGAGRTLTGQRHDRAGRKLAFDQDRQHRFAHRAGCANHRHFVSRAHVVCLVIWIAAQTACAFKGGCNFGCPATPLGCPQGAGPAPCSDR